MSAAGSDGLPGLSVRRPMLAAVLNLLIVIAGVAAIMGVEVRELPDIDRPVVSVRANYPGGSPTTIDAEVTSIVESGVARVAGVLAVEPSSEEGNFRLRAEFRPDVTWRTTPTTFARQSAASLRSCLRASRICSSSRPSRMHGPSCRCPSGASEIRSTS